MDNPEVALRFGLLLEVYCRGSPNHMLELQKQVRSNMTSLNYRGSPNQMLELQKQVWFKYDIIK